MSTFNSLTEIPVGFRFNLSVDKYGNGKPISQVCVVGSTPILLKLAPLKQNGVAQPVQEISINPLFIGQVRKVGTIIFFEEGKSKQFHTVSVETPEYIMSHYT